MRLRLTVGTGVTALAIATSLAGTAAAQSPSGPPSLSTSVTATAATRVQATPTTCFSNLVGITGVAIESENLPEDSIDSAGADDFRLRTKCRLKSVTTPGQYFIGERQAGDNETVTIYKNKSGEPAKVVAEQTTRGTEVDGTFYIQLKTVKLQPGHYWLSVVANTDSPCCEGPRWGWETTSSSDGAAALWRNPGDGLATGCTTWSDMQACIGGDRGGDDFAFALN